MQFQFWRLVWVAGTTLAGVACSSDSNTSTGAIKGSCPPACVTTGSGGTLGTAASNAIGAAGGVGTLNTGASGHTSAGVAAPSSTSGRGAGGSVQPMIGSGGGAGMIAAAGSAIGGTTGASGTSVSGPGPGMPPPGGPISDYGAMGPFPTMTMDGSGPDGMYTMIRPTDVGANGFKHPIATWGNGITTTPSLYPVLLSTIASHGFVIIASDSSNVTADMMKSGLDWLIKQNDAGGMFAGKLDVTRAVSIGYSLGGGAAVDTGSHPAVIATVSFHGLPGASGSLHGPLLLMTTTADGFVTKDGFVKPCYDASSKVPTIMATMAIAGYTAGPNGGTASNADFGGHLYPLNDAGDERAPAIAWLRLWVYGDEGGKKYFYGSDCLLCKDPWIDIQRKNAMW